MKQQYYKVKHFVNIHAYPFTLLLVGMIACFAMVQLNDATPYGPAFGSDSVTYMESAKNFAAGKGLGLINPDGSFRLIPYDPPLYPLVLSLLTIFGIDLLQGAFWLNTLLFGVIIFLSGWAGYRKLRSSLAAILISGLLALSGVLITVFIWVMSDPLCLVLGVIGLLLMLFYLDSGSRKYLILSALLTGLAFLTRYAGIAYCVTCVLAVILFEAKPIKKRLLAAGLYGLISIVPMIIWLIIDLSVAGSVGSRGIQPINELLPSLLEFAKTLKGVMYLWLPYFMSLSQAIGQTAFRLIYFSLFLVILFALGYAIFRLRRKYPDGWRFEIGYAFGGLFALFLIVYLITIALSYALIYPRLSLTDRMFAPFNFSLIILLSVIIMILYKAYRSWLPRLLTIGFSLIMLMAFYGGSREVITHQDQFPPEYSGFKDSGLVTYLNSLPEDTPLISDKAQLVLYYTDQPTYAIQEFFSDMEEKGFLPYGSDMQDEAQRVFRENGGALVLTWLVHREFTSLYGDQAGDYYSVFVKDLYLAFDSPEGKVYFYKNPD